MDKYAWGVLVNQNNDASFIMDDYKYGLQNRLKLEMEHASLSRRLETLNTGELIRFKALEEAQNVSYENYFIDKTLELIEGNEDYNYNDVMIQLGFIAFSNSVHHVTFYRKLISVIDEEFELLTEWDEDNRRDRRDFLIGVNALAKLHLNASVEWSYMEDGVLPSVRNKD